MNGRTKHLIIISLDGLSTLDFDYISSLPNFKEILSVSSYCKKVYSVYPTLTYPAHASIVTGRHPKNHGIINNTLLQVNRKSPDWFWQSKYIKGDTLFNKAVDEGLKVASLMWPVTAKSKIQFNMPEIFANRPWKTQVMVSLLNGSPLYQIDLNNKFGHLRQGIKQPYLDNFTHSSLLYTLDNKKPDLTLVHYTDLDSVRHHHGFHSLEAREALQRHDERLGEIVQTLKESNMFEESTIIILGDHSSLDEHTTVKLNLLLCSKGYIELNTKGKISSYRAIFKSCDGSAYLYLKDKKDTSLVQELLDLLQSFNEEYHCIEEIYESSRACELGADPNCALMLEANKGYSFSDDFTGMDVMVLNTLLTNNPSTVGSTHGYSPYKENYTTVFIAAGSCIKRNIVIDKMNLIDEGPTFAKLLGLELNNVDGRVLEEILI